MKVACSERPPEMSKRTSDFLDELYLQVDEEENQSPKNVFSNMKKLEKGPSFNPSRLVKQKFPGLQSQQNDLNVFVSPSNNFHIQPNKIGGQIKLFNYGSAEKKINQELNKNRANDANQKVSCSCFSVNSGGEKMSKKQNHLNLAEENINDVDYSSSEFDVSENEAVGQNNINSSVFSQGQNALFNQKIKEFNERKSRCHTLMPKQAQKYFREQKSARSYIITGSNTSRQPENDNQMMHEQYCDEMRNERKRSEDIRSKEQDDSNKRFQFQMEMKRLQIQQEQFQNQIASSIPKNQIENVPIAVCLRIDKEMLTTNHSKTKSQQQISSKGIFDYEYQSNQQKTVSQQNQFGISHLQKSYIYNAKSEHFQQQPFKEDAIQKQIVQSKIIQAKLQEQAKNIEDKKNAFQDQFIRNSSNRSNTFQQQQQEQMQPQLTQRGEPINRFSSIQNEKTEYKDQISNRQSTIKRNNEFSHVIDSSQQTIEFKLKSELPLQETVKLNEKNNAHPSIQNRQFSSQETKMQKDNHKIEEDLFNSQLKNSQPQNIEKQVESVYHNVDIQNRASQKLHEDNKKGNGVDFQYENKQLSSRLESHGKNDMLTSLTSRTKKQFQSNHLENEQSAPYELDRDVGTLKTIDVKDTQTFKSIFEKHIETFEELKISDAELFSSLIKSIFSHDTFQIEDILNKIHQKERYHIINQKDEKGNTPLLLAVKLAYTNPIYFKIIKLLLKQDADPRIRDAKGWSCFEEVASQKDHQLALSLFETLIGLKNKVILQQKREIDNMLAEVPDFYMEMKWEFESAIIPFVSKFAPSDTFKIWKYGRSVRCDSTYAGLQKYRSKRRAQSLIFNSLNLNSKGVNVSTDFDFLVIIHKDLQTFHFPLEELDSEEKSKILDDLLGSSESLQGDLKIEKSQITPTKSLFGNKQHTTIQGYQCQKYDLMLKYRYMIFKKTHVPFVKNIDHYNYSMTDLTPQSFVGISPRDYSYISEKNQDQLNNSINQKEIKMSLNDVGNPFEIQIQETNKNEVKKSILSLYVSEKFPMKFSVFLPLLQFLSNGNSLLNNLNEIFKDPGVKEVLFNKGFPVKMQIPLSYSIYANITFSSYEYIQFFQKQFI